MTVVHRVLLLTVLLAVVGAAVLLGHWATRPKMTILYGGLTTEEAARVVDKLRDQDVPYELNNGGTTVQVPVEQVDSCRMTLAGSGVPSGGQAGYKILDDEKLGTSPFTQRVNYIRAVEGELAKTIQTLQNVNGARVHIVRPEGALFAGKEKDSSATVVVSLRGGRTLAAHNVAAIVHLVSGAVEGLRPDKVVVVDTGGNLLSGEENSELAGKASSFQSHRAQVERSLSEKAEQLLAAALGPNRASVRVSVEMTTQATSASKEVYDPVNRVVAHESIDSKSSSGGGSDSAGDTKEETIDTEYLVSKTVEQIEQMPGDIVSKSVAVLVDLSPRPAEGEEGGEPPMNKDDVEQLVAGALGLRLEAGPDGDDPADSLSVVSTTLPAAPAAEEVGEGGMFSPAFLLDMAKRASLGLAVIGMLLALKLFGGSKDKKAGKAEGDQTALAADRSAGELPGASGQGGRMLPATEPAGGQDQLRRRITRALEDNPEEVKRLFLAWAESDKGEQ